MAGMELSQLPTEEIIAVYRRVWSEAERRWGVTILAGYLCLAVYAAASIARPAVDGDPRGQPHCAVARRTAEPDVAVGALHGGARRADKREPRVVGASADCRRTRYLEPYRNEAPTAANWSPMPLRT